MNQPQRILVVEIKTMDSFDLEPSQINSFTVYENSGNYYLAWNFQHIKSLIIDAIKNIISLGNNYRHPLYFNVQVISGDGMDASVELTKSRSQRRRFCRKKLRKTE